MSDQLNGMFQKGIVGRNKQGNFESSGVKGYKKTTLPESPYKVSITQTNRKPPVINVKHTSSGVSTDYNIEEHRKAVASHSLSTDQGHKIKRAAQSWMKTKRGAMVRRGKKGKKVYKRKSV